MRLSRIFATIARTAQTLVSVQQKAFTMAERHRSQRDLFRDKIAKWASAGWKNNPIIQELAKFDVKLSKGALTTYINQHGLKAKLDMPPEPDSSDGSTDTDDRSNLSDHNLLPSVSDASEYIPP